MGWNRPWVVINQVTILLFSYKSACLMENITHNHYGGTIDNYSISMLVAMSVAILCLCLYVYVYMFMFICLCLYIYVYVYMSMSMAVCESVGVVT